MTDPTDDLWTLLAAGGMTARLSEDGGIGEAGWTYDPLADPVGAGRLGGLLSERGRAVEPSVVVVPDDLGSAILGFLVGARLEVPVLRLFDSEGLLRSSEPPPPGAAGLLVADAFRDGGLVRAAQELFEQHGGRMAGAVALVGVPAPDAPGGLIPETLVDPRESGNR